MNTGANHSRAGHNAALAGLAASAALFFSALSGIASIDPSANAATRTVAPAPVTSDVSADRRRERTESRRDCPRRPGRDAGGNGVTS